MIKLFHFFITTTVYLIVITNILVIVFTFLLSSGILVLLVFRNKVVHVGLGLSEFHLVHTLTSVPVKEGLAAEHSSELLGNTLEHLLNGGGISNECSAHLESLGRDIA